MLMFFAHPVFAQKAPGPEVVAPQTEQASSPFTLTVRSQLVQLDVVVRDAKGMLIKNLKADDFRISENGTEEKIVSFEAIEPLAATNTEQLRVDSTAELDRRAPEAPVTILVLDELSSRFEDQYFARYSMEQYLKNQPDTLTQPVMLVARSIDRTMVLADYTTSKKKILETLKRHLAENDWRANNPNFNEAQVGAAFASLLEVAKATHGHPGHKNLVWVGRGFPTLQWQNIPQDEADGLKAEVAKCVDLLRESRITLYVIDPAGVQGVSGTSDEYGNASIDDPFDDAVSFDSLAIATGGASMHGRNDVDHLIGTAVENGENFYTLSYRPAAPAEDDPKRFRHIKVTLKDPGLTASTRTGYYRSSDRSDMPVTAESKGKLGEGAVFDLAAASSSLMVFDGIPLALDRHDKELQVSFPANALGLEAADGKLKADVTLIALGYDRTGKILSRDGRVVSLHLAPLTEGKTEDRTVHLTTPVNTALPLARMRIVLRANSNGNIGADNVFLTDPTTLKDRATGLKPR